MRMVFGLVLILGLGLAGFAVYLARDYMDGKQAALDAARAQQMPAVPTQQVFVMTRTARYGEKLSPEDVRPVAWPVDAIPEGVFTDKDALFPDNNREARAILRTMEKNEAVMASKVTEPGEDAGVSSRLSKGMRAFAVRVDVSSGVSGFLRPGDRVDVYWSGNLPKSNGRQEVTKLIETGVRLIGIDQSVDEDRSGATVARTVTVEATSLQVAALAQAQSTGRLSLALVGSQDESVAQAIEVNQKDLLGIEDEQVIEVEKQQVCTIRTRKGAEVVEIPIPCTN
ncbi:Flp pilus assembly protein CpaB [Oceaniglobus indicus]|uniref:Flp pilus assembly protein CpaB n=1 Tax=Oceaniglobus indicus TaxID=2047749 RepID=UPI000C18AC2D|nr:Flp pilus assembly protein CpaB [Oceaniglobus indicus]